MPIIWTEHLSVKSEVMDEDHQYLISIVNEIEQLASTKNHDAILKAVDHLVECAEYHFTREEKFSLFVGCYLHHSHTPQINHIITRKQMLIDMYADDWTSEISDSFVTFLMDWVGIHIVVEDMQLKSAFEKYPLDFNPMQLLPLRELKGLSPAKVLTTQNNEDAFV